MEAMDSSCWSVGVKGERLRRFRRGFEAQRGKGRLNKASATASPSCHLHLQSLSYLSAKRTRRAPREIIIGDAKLQKICRRRRRRELQQNLHREVLVRASESESGDKAEDKEREFTYNPEKGQGR